MRSGRIFRCAQGSDLWLAAKVGRISASNIDCLLAPPTTRASTRKGVSCPAGTEALAKTDYFNKLVVERIYGRATDSYVTRQMQEGIDREPYARMLYEANLQGEFPGMTVELVGFALHPEWDWWGSSADGLVGTDGGVELKAPAETTHDGYATDPNTLVEDYKGQVLSNLICFPEREWWDLVSFSPYAPDVLKLVKAPRFYRSDWAETIAKIEYEAQVMNERVETEISRRGLPPTVFTVMP